MINAQGLIATGIMWVSGPSGDDQGNARNFAEDAIAPKRTRPDTGSGRAALTDAGVDGGARADRNYQAWRQAPVIRTHRDGAKIRVSLAPRNFWRPPWLSQNWPFHHFSRTPLWVGSKRFRKESDRLRGVVAVLIVSCLR